MTLEEAHIDFKLKWDSVDNKVRRNFSDEEIDWLLHDAQMEFIRTRFNETLRSPFEFNSSRIHELSNLHIKFPEEPEIVLSPIDYSNYKLSILDVSKLSNSYLYLTNLELYDDTCKEWISGTYQDTRTYLEELKNPFNISNGIYNINSTDENTSIYIYGNNTKARVSYLKYPNRVYLGTYKHPFIQSNVKVEFSLPKHTVPIIVDIAVKNCKIIETNTPENKQSVNILS